LAIVVGFTACDASGGVDEADTAFQDTVSGDGVTDTAMTDDTSVADDTAGAGDTIAADDTAAPPDTSEAADTNGRASCPPSGPFGTEVGDVLADLTLYDCDGNPHAIAELCGRPASLLTAFAGWCPICRGDAAHANADYLGFKSKDPAFEWYFVITEPDAANSMTAAYCEAIRDDYGLTMPVLIDTDGVFPGHIGVTSTNAWTVALDAEGVILAKDKYDETNAFAKVNARLE